MAVTLELPNGCLATCTSPGSVGSACAAADRGEAPSPASSAERTDSSRGPRKRLPLKTKLIIGLGESVQVIYAMIAGYYLNSFLLETACIDPMYVGLMQASQGAFDAVNDPIIGRMSDRTRTRWGRRRPWLLFGGPFIAVFYCGLWNALPHWVPQIWKFIYACVCYMGVSVGITAIGVQIGSLVPELTDDYDERTNISGWRMGCGGALALVAALTHNQMINLQPSRDPAVGFRISGGVFGMVLCCLAWITFAGIRERFDTRQESRRQMRLGEELHAVVTNKAFLCVAGAYLCGPTAVVLVQSNLMMFCKYQLKDADIVMRIIPCVQISALLCLPFWVWLTSKLSKSTVYVLAGAVLVPGVSCTYFVQTETAALLLSTLAGTCLSIPYVIPMSMLPDVIEEDELRTGKRREGIFVGFFTIMLKMSVAGALMLTNFVLKAVGYRPPQYSCGGAGEDLAPEPVQPEIVIKYIRHLCSSVPAVFFLTATLLCWLCPMTRSKQAVLAKLAMEARLERLSETSDDTDGKTIVAEELECTDCEAQLSKARDEEVGGSPPQPALETKKQDESVGLPGTIADSEGGGFDDRGVQRPGSAPLQTKPGPKAEPKPVVMIIPRSPSSVSTALESLVINKLSDSTGTESLEIVSRRKMRRGSDPPLKIVSIESTGHVRAGCRRESC